jgi:hypothetical protein
MISVHNEWRDVKKSQRWEQNSVAVLNRMISRPLDILQINVGHGKDKVTNPLAPDGQEHT